LTAAGNVVRSGGEVNLNKTSPFILRNIIERFLPFDLGHDASFFVS